MTKSFVAQQIYPHPISRLLPLAGAARRATKVQGFHAQRNQLHCQR
ncbi:MAG: hypothetical protein QM520_06380 [Gammaproteobacteria bacterium]|nr:hypothetical protein [Gammaproteobacteria bacterium]